MREIARLAPDLAAGDAELAWRLGTSQPLLASDRARAGDAYVALLECFERTHGVDASVRSAAARALGRAGLVRLGMRLRPAAPIEVARDRTARRGRMRQAHRSAQAWLAELEPEPRQLRVTVVSPEPTPYRSPLFDLIAARQDIDLTVIYAARSVAEQNVVGRAEPMAMCFCAACGIPGRAASSATTIRSRPARRARSRGRGPTSSWSPGGARSPRRLRSPGAARDAIPTSCTSRATISAPGAPWRRARERRRRDPRDPARRASVLVVGSAARDSVVARGASRVRVFANTIDVDALDRARGEARTGCPRRPGRALGRAARAGEGVRHSRRTRARAAGVRLELVTGGVAEDELAQRYVDADVFALLSRHEPWGVVVNEAAASGLPLVLSDQVGAAYRSAARRRERLPRSGRRRCCCGRRAADDSRAMQALRARMGVRSRELVRRLGLRAVGRQLRGCRARGHFAVDLLLDVGRRDPRKCAAPPQRLLARADRAGPSPPRTRRTARDDRRPLVGHDERLAVLEEAGDAAPVGDDHRRPGGSGLGSDHAEALAGGGEHEDIGLRIEVVAVGRRSSAACGRARSSQGLSAPPGRRRSMPVVGAGDDDVSFWEAPGRRRGGARSLFPRLCVPRRGSAEPRPEFPAARGDHRSPGRRPAWESRCPGRGPSRRATPHSTTASRSRSEATTTAAAPRATPR